MRVGTQLFRVTALTLVLGSVGWNAEAGQRRGSRGSNDEGAAQGQGQAVRRGSRADNGRSRREAAPPPRASAPAVRRNDGVRSDRGAVRADRRDGGRAVPRRAPDRWNGRDGRAYRRDDRRDRRYDRWDGRNDRWYGVDRRYYRYSPPRVIVPRYAPRRYYGPGGNFSVYFGWGSGYRFGRWYDGRVYGYVPPVVAYGTPRYYGDIRLKVRPRHAEVYVDGYYAGIVDNFDGVFQRLTVEAGRHEIEIVAPGYEPRLYEVYVDPTRTVELHGDLDGAPY